MLLALAARSQEARLSWRAARAAVRARGDNPGRSELWAYDVQAGLCLITAISAADLPATFTVYDVTLSRDPLAAAEQLREIAYGHDYSGPIEAPHEAARLAYKAAFAEPLSEQEHHLVAVLASLPAARRDKITDLVEQRARHRGA
ncbi:hypothetical protein [Micromonospora sp. NPDC049497]|uniref:hypothetical protein n=1 Tax=Micromonospora sp. NPDC049497 TaxID=3364273 RepID=UPI00378A9AAA